MSVSVSVSVSVLARAGRVHNCSGIVCGLMVCSYVLLIEVGMCAVLVRAGESERGLDMNEEVGMGEQVDEKGKVPGKRNSVASAGELMATFDESTQRLVPRGLDRSARYMCCSPHTP